MAVDAAPTVELNRAVAAVSGALSALRTNPRADAVSSALHRASAAVEALEPDLTTIVLRRLLVSIEDCHLGGQTHSPRLALCARTTSRALRLDPRWTAPERPRGVA
ncbi:MAG: hypothetical protein ACT4O0_13505 [Pseudonocardia sp.]|jgi:hypothetical protein